MSDRRPLVSIVIPVYNGANYLRGAIDSALAQSYENVEIVVVNDGSTDSGETESIALSYGHRIRYYSKANQGVSTALNMGISIMNGEYFSWLSHDDCYCPDKVARQLRFIELNSGVRVVGSGFHIIDEHGSTKSSYVPSTPGVVKNGREVLDYWVNGSSLLINKTIFEEVGVFNENNRTTQDIDLWLRIVHSGNHIHLLPDLLIKYRQHPNMGSNQMRPVQIREIENLFDELLSKYPLEFFSNEENYALTKRDKASIYNWLGNHVLQRGGLRSSRAFFNAAAMAYPNPLDALFRSSVRKVISTHPLYVLFRSTARKVISASARVTKKSAF